MVGEDVISEILEYLKKAGPTNTFRLSSVMDIDRAKLLNLLKQLEEKQAIRFEHGNAVFIKFVSGEKPKTVEFETSSPRPKQKIERKPAQSKALQLLQTENTQLRGKLSRLKETVRELEKKASARPKTITRTIIKKVPVTKTTIKKVPVVKTVVKRISVPRPLLSKKKEKPKVKRKFKMPSFTFMKNIKQLKKPEFAKK